MKKKVRVCVWRRKKWGGKKGRKYGTCVEEKKKRGEKRGKKKKEMLSHYFHNTFIINLKW